MLPWKCSSIVSFFKKLVRLFWGKIIYACAKVIQKVQWPTLQKLLKLSEISCWLKPVFSGYIKNNVLPSAFLFHVPYFLPILFSKFLLESFMLNVEFNSDCSNLARHFVATLLCPPSFDCSLLEMWHDDKCVILGKPNSFSGELRIYGILFPQKPTIIL